MRSVEADIALFADEDGAKSDLVDGSIGEASMSIPKESRSRAQSKRTLALSLLNEEAPGP